MPPGEEEAYLRSLGVEADQGRRAERRSTDGGNRTARPLDAESPTGTTPDNFNGAEGPEAREQRARLEEDHRATTAEDSRPSEAVRPGPSTQNSGGPGRDPLSREGDYESGPAAKSQPSTEPTADKAKAHAAVFGGAVRSALGNFMADRREQSDARHLEGRARKVRDASRAVEEDLGALRKVGRDFFEAFDEATAKEGASVEKVIAGMTENGAYGDLRKQYHTALDQTPGFADAWEKLRKSAGRLGKEAELLASDASVRGASGDASVKAAEEEAAKVGHKLEKLPGHEPGKDFIKEVGAALERLVNRFRDFFTEDRKRTRDRTPDNSPSPGA